MPRPGARFQAAQMQFKVPARVYRRVTAIKLGLEDQEGRQVTLGEAVDRMAELWERASAAVAEKEEL